MENKEQKINKQVEKNQTQKSQTPPTDQNQTSRVYNAGELSNTGDTGSHHQKNDKSKEIVDVNDRVSAAGRGKLPNEKKIKKL